MNTIIVKTQTEIDNLPDSFKEYTVIEIRSDGIKVSISKRPRNSSVVAWENSSVVAWGNSSVVAWENSSVVAWGNSSVVARGNSSVVARGNSSVVAWGNSSVEAWENSSVVARGNSSVVARGNSSVEAWENSSVVARGNSSVVARGNSSVEAWENSSVVAWENSSVVAQDFALIAVLSATVIIKKLMDYSIASLRGIKVKIEKKARTATVVKTPAFIKHNIKSFAERCDSDKPNTVILYKSVDKETKCDFRTGTIEYKGVVTCPDWDPSSDKECGNGLHLSPTPGMALSYNQGHLLKCRVNLKDIAVFESNITKVRCRQVEVIGDYKKSTKSK